MTETGHSSELVSILIPTYNESENIAGIIEHIGRVLYGRRIGYEILVIDDASTDNTVQAAQMALGRNGRVIRRVADRKSLSLSVLQGIREATGDIIVVMDADGSHPAELIPQFVRAMDEGYDLVVASRYVKGGRIENLTLIRRIISKFACLLGRSVTGIRDNTSGFFCIRKKILEGVKLAPCGFKIGLEIFSKANIDNNYQEIPYIFTNRKRGRSKLSIIHAVQYLGQVLGLFTYKLRVRR